MHTPASFPPWRAGCDSDPETPPLESVSSTQGKKKHYHDHITHTQHTLMHYLKGKEKEESDGCNSPQICQWPWCCCDSYPALSGFSTWGWELQQHSQTPPPQVPTATARLPPGPGWTGDGQNTTHFSMQEIGNSQWNASKESDNTIIVSVEWQMLRVTRLGRRDDKPWICWELHSLSWGQKQRKRKMWREVRIKNKTFTTVHPSIMRK